MALSVKFNEVYLKEINVGFEALKVRDWVKVEEVADRVLKLFPNSTNAGILKAFAMKSKGKLDGAFSILQDLTNKFPKSIDLWYLRGMTAMELWEIDDGLYSFSVYSELLFKENRIPQDAKDHTYTIASKSDKFL